MCVVFPSSLRSDSTPCISHETTAVSHDAPSAKTLCGRALTEDTTWEPESEFAGDNWEPDCTPCRRASQKLRGLPQDPIRVLRIP